MNYFLKMPTEMLLPPGYTDPASMKRVRAAKVTGKPQSIEDVIKAGVVIVGSPNTVREKLAEYQDLAGFNTSLTKTQFGNMHGAPRTGRGQRGRRCRRKPGRIPGLAARGARDGKRRIKRGGGRRRLRPTLVRAPIGTRPLRPMAIQSSLTPAALTTSPHRPRSAAI